MYARISSALAAGASRVSTAYVTVAPPLSAAPMPTPYVLDCGTLTTATWPPAAAPVIVTATSVVHQRPLPAVRQRLPTVVSADRIAAAHPRQPHPVVVSRSSMWYTATTRAHRGYALGRSTTNLTAKPFAAAAGETNAETPMSTTTVAAEGSEQPSSGASASSSPSPTATEPVVSGSVTLPDAMVFSFTGNPHEFQDRLRGANVLVFFYKAVCGPCAAIRSKLIHAVTERLPMDAASSILHGASHKSKKTELSASTVAADEPNPPLSSSPPAHADESDEPAAAAAATSDVEAAMGVEDKAACAFACRTLEDVAKAYPHRMIFLTVDTNDNAKLTALHDIRSLPTFIAYRDGCMVGRVEGADEEEVRRLVQSITTEEREASAEGSAAPSRDGPAGRA